jgi:hypothetical protein
LAKKTTGQKSRDTVPDTDTVNDIYCKKKKIFSSEELNLDKALKNCVGLPSSGSSTLDFQDQSPFAGIVEFLASCLMKNYCFDCEKQFLVIYDGPFSNSKLFEKLKSYPAMKFYLKFAVLNYIDLLISLLPIFITSFKNLHAANFIKCLLRFSGSHTNYI